MKKIAATFLTLVMLLSILALSVYGLGETMNVNRGTIVVDGKIDDAWAGADRQALTHLTNGDQKANGLPEDWYAYASALWDDEWVYFMFECKDDDWVMDNDIEGHWRNDCIYLYIDENQLYDATWKDGQYQLALIPAEDMSLLPRNGSPIPEDAVKFAYAFDGDLCIMEVAFKPQFITPADGVKILADFQRHDDTDAMTRDYCVSWSDEEDKDSSDSSVWGELTFVAATASATEAPAAEAPATEAATVAEEPINDSVDDRPLVIVAPQTSDAFLLIICMIISVVVVSTASKKNRI